MKKIFLLLLFILSANQLYAGTGLPFESTLTTVSNSISGPVALSIGVVALAVAAFTFAFNPELNGMLKGLIGISLALSIVFLGKAFIEKVFKPASTGNVITITEKISSDEKLNE